MTICKLIPSLHYIFRTSVSINDRILCLFLLWPFKRGGAALQLPELRGHLNTSSLSAHIRMWMEFMVRPSNMNYTISSC